jgi:hypothetical protein
MARLFWLIVMLGFVGMLAAGASWVAAYSSLGDVLGAPPPRMGTQSTTLLWRDLPRLRQRPAPALWRFAFSPTAIPGARTVRIYIGPWGRVVATEPPDLSDKLVAFHRTGY